MINVTQTFLPPLEEYNVLLKRVWDNKWLTNRGELVLELETEIAARFKTCPLFITTNGTLPLQIAIKTLPEGSEIITTPFSYVATTSSILWENAKPVFVDIDPDYMTIDADKIASAITPKTKAILATHVFGNPCDVEAIEAIARAHNLIVIYDAAHCFGVSYKGESLFNYGDISTCSFHATKIFHTAEGGAVFCKDEKLRHELYYRHNFGHNGPHEFHGVGINAKVSELQAAMGLAVLPYFHQIKQDRKQIVEDYLSKLHSDRLGFLKIRPGTDWNYSYFPIVCESETLLLEVQKQLNAENIFPRRYFFPSLNTLPFVEKSNMPVSEFIASRILCLPLYSGLLKADVNRICHFINQATK